MKAVFNIDDKEDVDKLLLRRLYTLVKSIRAAWYFGRVDDSNRLFFHDYVAMLGTMHCQSFFTKSQHTALLGLLGEAVATRCRYYIYSERRRACPTEGGERRKTWKLRKPAILRLLAMAVAKMERDLKQRRALTQAILRQDIDKPRRESVGTPGSSTDRCDLEVSRSGPLTDAPMMAVATAASASPVSHFEEVAAAHFAKVALRKAYRESIEALQEKKMWPRRNTNKIKTNPPYHKVKRE